MPSNRGISDRLGLKDKEYEQHLASVPANDDGPIWVVNLIKLKERADYGDGDDRGESGQQAYDGTMPLTALEDAGAEVVFFGETLPVSGDGPQFWDRATAVKYPTRRSFIALRAQPDVEHAIEQKIAGLEETIVLACIPSPTMPVPAHLTVPAWSTVPHPATDDDSPITVMHLIRYADDAWDPEDIAGYAHAIAAVSVPHGARATRWFAVEGTLVGDGRVWDDVRFTAYPSHAALLAARRDLSSIPDYSEQRARVIADHYTVVLRSRVDRLVRSVNL